MLEIWTQPQTWISLLTLAALEIVLGIDNVVFISILAAKLPEERQSRGRRLGLGMALVTRVLLLLGISWVMGLTATLFTVLGQDISGRDLVTLVGGLFLVAKATYEIFEALEVEQHERPEVAGSASYALIIGQIMLLDVVFSLDSVITAVGMVPHVQVMVAAVLVAVGVMMIFADPIGRFVTHHPSVKVLALAFLILIGVMLIAESFEQHIPKGYIYFAMAFSLAVELINMRIRSKRKASMGVPTEVAG